MAKRNETDLDAVKIVAKALLYTDIHPTKFSPMIVQHPFTNTGIVGFNKDGQTLCLNIAESKEDLAEWQRLMDKKIEEAKDVYRIYIHLNKPYALTFVDMAEPHLSEQDFAGLLQDAWMRSENPNQDCNVPKSRLVSLFSSADKEHLMTESDREVYDSLEDKITVYRGVRPRNTKDLKALSWTLDYQVAQWFAERYIGIRI